MPESEPQDSRSEAGPHLLLYDGGCGLCHGLVRAVLERDRGGVFHFASLQGRVATEQLDRFGDRSGLGDTVVVIANYQGHPAECLTKARAAIFVMRALGWPWRAAAVFGLLPATWLDRAYDMIARHRYRIFGRRDQCFLPGPEYQRRFPDRADAVAAKPEVS